MRILGVLFALIFLSGCWENNGGEETGVSSVSYEPLSYLLIGEASATIRPTVQGSATRFSITPSLPTGLIFSADTGEITGIPAGPVGDLVEYTVTAEGASSSAFARFSLALVNSLDPIDLDPAGNIQISVSGIDPGAFNPTNVRVQYSATAGSFSSDPRTVSIRVNGIAVAEAAVTTGTSSIAANLSLIDGQNVVVLSARDSRGAPVENVTRVWAGANTQQVRLVTPSGAAFTNATQVTARLSDDLTLAATADVVSGVATFQNLPSRTLILEAVAQSGFFGSSGAFGADSSSSIVLLPFAAPSNVNNNDLSLGLAGWVAAPGSTISIVPHQEPPPPAAIVSPAGFSSRAVPGQYQQHSDRDRQLLHEEARLSFARQSVAGPTGWLSPWITNQALPDNDIRLRTQGEGTRLVSRTFTASADTREVSVRYRFVTSEVPGGFFGSRYNDYFSVSVRSQRAGGVRWDSASMNALGLAAFDFGSGSTAYRTVSLDNLQPGDVVQVDVAVANVGDGLLDSFVDVDFVDEEETVIRPRLVWNEAAGGLDLSYTVEGAPLTETTPIQIFWASGPNSGSRLGAAISTATTIAAGTGPGTYGPFRIEGNILTGDPSGVTHLIAVAGTDVGAISDVQLAYGPTAFRDVVSLAMLDLLRDGARVAGRAGIVIRSTARSPEGQAQEMFTNLTRGDDLAQNIVAQKLIYAPPGEQVIDVFAGLTTGLSASQARLMSSSIIPSMTSKINALGPSSVSKHCADPALISVVDVGISSSGFSAASGARFRAYVRGTGARLLDENGAYHIERPR